MADKKLNEVTKVTDMAYVPVIMADGSVGQIAKSDLASVVAEVMKTTKMVQNVGIGGGKTYMLGQNIYEWNRRHVICYINSSLGNHSSIVKLSYMGSHIYAVYSGVNPETLGIRFGYTKSGNEVSVYMKSTNGSDTTLSVTVIGYDLVKESSDSWSNDLTPITDDNFGYNSLAELSAGVASEMGIIRKAKNLLPNEEFVVSNTSLGIAVISSNSSGNTGLYIVSAYGVIKITETSNNFSSQIAVSTVDGGGIKVTNIHSVSRYVEVVIKANNGR